uniref:FAD-binding oxidoreductase n=1 Tax=Hylemonella sp. TaxID=2066020 RepID=UPI0035AF2026
MIPALSSADLTDSLTLDYIAELQARGFQGDVGHTHGDRTVFATDNSIYQLAPQAILFPRNDEDVVRIAKVANDPRFASLTFAPRGGGTGTNGQSLTRGICVDLSRHMHSILEINVKEG